MLPSGQATAIAPLNALQLRASAQGQINRIGQHSVGSTNGIQREEEEEEGGGHVWECLRGGGGGGAGRSCTHV